MHIVMIMIKLTLYLYGAGANVIHELQACCIDGPSFLKLCNDTLISCSVTSVTVGQLHEYI